MHRKKMKQKAKELLQGIWGRAIALLFCLAAIMVFFSCLERMIVSFSGMSTLEQLFSPLFLYGTVSVHIDTLLFASALFIGSSVLSFLFGTSLRQGIICWYYRRTLGEILPISRTFNWYTSPKRWGKALAVHLLLLVKTALWTALFLLPSALLYFGYIISTIYHAAAWQSFLLFILTVGLTLGGLIGALVVCYRYFLVLFILADDPEVRVRTAFRSSIRIMTGKKGELLALDISFLPYYLLNFLIVPMLGTIPYIEMTKALYARRYILNYQLEVLSEKQETKENIQKL